MNVRHHFLTAIWLPDGQLWAIIEGAQPRYKIPCDIRIENVKTVLITVFSHFQSECHRESCSEVGSLSPV